MRSCQTKQKDKTEVMASTGFTFKVDDVKPSTTSLSPIKDWEQQIADRCCVPKPESFSAKPMSGWTPVHQRHGGGTNALLWAINTAYDQHYPLVLSPDIVWLVIAQGFARHVNENHKKKKLRKLFVT